MKKQALECLASRVVKAARELLEALFAADPNANASFQAADASSKAVLSNVIRSRSYGLGARSRCLVHVLMKVYTARTSEWFTISSSWGTSLGVPNKRYLLTGSMRVQGLTCN
jgi:hypothetical protein